MRHDDIAQDKIMFNPAQAAKGVENIGRKVASDGGAPRVSRMKLLPL
jgi:hypothetical protein